MTPTDHQFEEAIKYLYHFIPKTDMNRFPGEYGLKRTRMLLQLLDNPQEKVKVIHIAGTSGKGSTAMVMSHLLQNHGFKVGLHVKPHIIDVRERFQINNTLIAKEAFYQYLQDVRQAVEKMDETYGTPTYFEVVVSLAFYIFCQEKVDYAVVEAGVGGLYDGSNTISNPDKLVLLTSIGFDHMAILGNTLGEIAYHKAMVMHKGNTAFSIKQPEEVKHVFTEVAQKQGASLQYVVPPVNISIEEDKTLFDFSFGEHSWKQLELHLMGAYQAENAALAMTGFIFLSQRDHFAIKEETIRKTLTSLIFPGRFEIRHVQGKTIVIDGAHNTQKMEAFITSLTKMFPDTKFTFLIGFKEGKEIEAMVKMIVPLAYQIFVTGFFNDRVDFVVVSEKPEAIAKLIQQQVFSQVHIENDAPQHLPDILSKSNDILVITGSLYLIAELYPTINNL